MTEDIFKSIVRSALASTPVNLLLETKEAIVLERITQLEYRQTQQSSESCYQMVSSVLMLK
jgi:hypothetical protein